MLKLVFGAVDSTIGGRWATAANSAAVVGTANETFAAPSNGGAAVPPAAGAAAGGGGESGRSADAGPLPRRGGEAW